MLRSLGSPARSMHHAAVASVERASKQNKQTSKQAPTCMEQWSRAVERSKSDTIILYAGRTPGTTGQWSPGDDGHGRGARGHGASTGKPRAAWCHRRAEAFLPRACVVYPAPVCAAGAAGAEGAERRATGQALCEGSRLHTERAQHTGLRASQRAVSVTGVIRPAVLTTGARRLHSRHHAVAQCGA